VVKGKVNYGEAYSKLIMNQPGYHHLRVSTV